MKIGNRNVWALTCTCLLARASFELVAPTHLAIPYIACAVVETADPTFFDPPYENVARIKIGMTEKDVDVLLDHLNRPADPNVTIFTSGERWGTRFRRWNGTRGTITVTFQRDRVGMENEWRVVSKEIVPPPR